MTIEELCRRSHDVAVAHGWHEQKRSFGEAIALFHSEVSEALECYRDPDHQPGDIWLSDSGKPEGFVVELADLLIRIGDTVVDMDIPMIAYMFKDLSCRLWVTYGVAVDREMSIPDSLAHMHKDISSAFGTSDLKTKAFFLERVMERVGVLCFNRGWDLEKALLMKIKYNETRDYRHGGKRA